MRWLCILHRPELLQNGRWDDRSHWLVRSLLGQEELTEFNAKSQNAVEFR